VTGEFNLKFWDTDYHRSSQINNFNFHHGGTEDTEILIFMNGFYLSFFVIGRIYQSSLPLRPGTQDFLDFLHSRFPEETRNKQSASRNELHATVKPLISIRIDPDVLEGFKGQEAGYQTRMNAVLRMYMEGQTDNKNVASDA
jgi:uncharacterized protein (DUF4415 family)